MLSILLFVTLIPGACSFPTGLAETIIECHNSQTFNISNEIISKAMGGYGVNSPVKTATIRGVEMEFKSLRESLAYAALCKMVDDVAAYFGIGIMGVYGFLVDDVTRIRISTSFENDSIAFDVGALLLLSDESIEAIIASELSILKQRNAGGKGWRYDADLAASHYLRERYGRVCLIEFLAKMSKFCEDEGWRESYDVRLEALL